MSTGDTHRPADRGAASHNAASHNAASHNAASPNAARANPATPKAAGPDATSLESADRNEVTDNNDATAPDRLGFDLSRFLPYRMNVLAGRISRQLAAVYGAQFGLTIPEWRILAHLSQLPPGSGDVSVREVQARVDMDKAKVTRAAQRLEAAGLISKRANPDDRRLVRLALTDAGRQRMAVLVPWVQDYETRLLDVLNADERRTFLAALDKLEAATAPRSDEGGAAPNETAGDPPGANDPQG